MTQTILSEKQSTGGVLGSDVVNLAYHLRKRGFYIYKDGVWKPCKAIVYMNGAHTKTKGRIYNNSWKA